MSLDRATINQALRNWILTATGLADGKVILPFQAGTQPQYPYIVVNPRLQTKDVGMYDETQYGNGQVTHVQRRELTVAVDVYAAENATPSAQGLADLAHDGLDTIAVQNLLSTALLGRIDRGEVVDMTALVETQFVDRFHFEARFNAVGTSIEALSWINEVGATGTFTLPGGATATESVDAKLS